MSDRLTILDVAKFESKFQFRITKPDQILMPIMEKWDVEVRSDLIQQLCDGLTEIVRKHSRQPVTLQAQKRISDIGKALYRQLILPGPSGDRLQAVLCEHSLPLLISTEVPEIPWELLHDGQDFLGLKYAVGRQLLRSTGVPIATPWQGDHIRCLLIADPCNDLPEARREAQTLKRWLTQQGIECDLLLGSEANGVEVTIQLASGSYNFIHYSGHVDIDSATGTYGLVLSDQLLPSVEIERAVSNNGPVVILNGCDTASAKGLADAFLKSGAQLFVGTLFDVPDLGARRWVEAFYEALIAGQQAGEALRLARQATLNDPECSITWMAFVMYGNPCLQLVLGEGPSLEETPLDRVLQTLGLGRQDFDNACLNVLESSLKYAGEAGSVSSAHLFTAMLEGPDSRLRDYLQAHEVDPAEIRKGFERAFRFADLLLQAALADGESDIELSDSVSRVLRDAYNRAQEARRSQATFDDLLFAFTHLRGSGVSYLLRWMDVDLKEVTHSLEPELTSSEATESIRAQEHWMRPSSAGVASNVVSPGVEQLPFRTRGPKPAYAEQDPIAQVQRSTTKEGAESRPYTVRRFADASFPATVVERVWNVLQVQVLAAQRDERSVAMGVEMPGPGDQPARVEVCVLAPGFESMEALQRAIDVPPTGDSELVKFRLCARKTGIYKIRVDFVQNDRYIGTTQLDVNVVEAESEIESKARERKARVTGQPAIGQAGVPPDLTILIAEQPLATGKHQLKFILHSPSNGLYYRDAGESILSSPPDKWVSHVLGQLPEIAQEGDGKMVERRLKAIGNTLWDKLIPEAFRNIYWQVRDEIRTILIVTDDPWIPWEMIFPYDRTQQGDKQDDFLCVRFSVTRWLRGTPTFPRISISESRVIGAGVDDYRRFAPLISVDEEIDTVKSIIERIGARAVSLAPSRAELFDNLERGGFHHLHIACHGSASSRGGDLSTITLQDGALAPLDVAGAAMTFGRDHPIVFLNACETGRLGISLTRLGGWAERFITAGCSAFMGTLWEVSDDSAKEFAKIFYTGICHGATLGEACRRARSGIREGGDPTWLAYCLYADPQAVIVPLAEPSFDAVAERPVIGEPTGILEKAAEVVQAYWSTNDETPPLPPRDLDEHASAVSQILEQSARRAVEVKVTFIDSLLLFEALLDIPDSTVAWAFTRLGIPVQRAIEVFYQVNDNKTPSQEPPVEEIGISKSVAEILKIARLLANRSGCDQVQDIDILEAFVLHGKNGAIRLLIESGLEPDLLLSGAFQENGALSDRRFSRTARAILNDALRYAQHTRLVGSPQLLAALVNRTGSLARKKIKAQKGDLDSYVQDRLDGAIIHEDRPMPEAVNLDTCSTRVRRILNLAELLARVDAILVGEEHLLRAYLHCTQVAK